MYECGFEYMTDTCIIGAAAEQKDEEDSGEDESEGGGNSDHVSHNVPLQFVDMLLGGLNTVILQ
jgi:hypothetical protein